jgi:Protein of unknown function (DUF1353)
MNLRLCLTALVLLLVASGLSMTAFAATLGKFVGNVVVEWLEDDAFGHKMQLLEDFAFNDADGTTWLAPRGYVSDGVAVSPSFQSLVGPPYEGKNRKAALIHEYFCRARTAPWKEVHRMFHAASVAAGASETEAKIMYMAIYADGPRWAVKKSICERACHSKDLVERSRMTWRPVVKETALRPIVEWIERDDPTLDQIDERVNAAIDAAGPHLRGEIH